MRVTIFAILLLLSACHNATDNSLAASDSLVIRFSGKAVDAERVVSTTDRNAIKKVANYLNGEAIKDLECDIDGKLLFFTKERLTDSVYFNYKDDCRNFIRVDTINPQPVYMNNEAANFFKDLAEGRN